MSFNKFAKAIDTQLQMMAKKCPNLFVVDVNTYDLAKLYVDSFPESINGVYKERRIHDCNCCKSFVRRAGHVVGFIDGVLTSIWDTTIAGHPEYQQVADALGKFVKSNKILEAFYTTEKTAGSKPNFDLAGVRHEHFYSVIPAKYVIKKDTNLNTVKVSEKVTLLKRALDEISLETVDTVLDLISDKVLLRGNTYLSSLNSFKATMTKYNSVEAKSKLNYIWSNIHKLSNIIGIRNTAIGTLLVDIQDGRDLQQACDSYNTKTDPTAYKRATSVAVSTKMVEACKADMINLGLYNMLDYRYVTRFDISVDNMLFRASPVSDVQIKDAFSSIATEHKTKELKNTIKMSLDKFIQDVLPKVDKVEILLEGKHNNRLVSMFKPINDEPEKRLLKWDNNFSWAYVGNVTDGIVERVKNAGGEVDARYCIRLAWNNLDDLDLHLVTPKSHVYFGNRADNGFELDVDQNCGVYNATNKAVENIFSNHLQVDGEYRVYVENFCARGRSKDDSEGFTIQTSFDGEVTNYGYNQRVNTKSSVYVLTFVAKGGKIVEIINLLPASSSSTKQIDMWGLQSNQFYPVQMILNSPNHWGDNKTGQKHVFFMIDGLERNADDLPRAIYNEFVTNALDKHRKVVERLGRSITPVHSKDQLSGIGFSADTKTEFTVKVSGKNYNRVIEVTTN